jgi:hypothetical protein
VAELYCKVLIGYHPKRTRQPDRAQLLLLGCAAGGPGCCAVRRCCARIGCVNLREKARGPLSQGVQAGRKALRKVRIRRINDMEVRKKRPRGSSELPEPTICFSLAADVGAKAAQPRVARHSYSSESSSPLVFSLQTVRVTKIVQGLAKIAKPTLGLDRDSQSKCWAKSRNLGQP